MASKKRIVTLDYLRGFLAISIVIYHYAGWTGAHYVYPFNVLIDRLGIYAVSIFFILSGVALALGYVGKKVDGAFIKDFWFKRISKLAPLFIIATTFTVIYNVYASRPPSIWELFTNYSLLFGFIDRDSYIAVGGWYIGLQLVFYIVFPLMLWLINKSVRKYVVFFMGTIVSTLYFSYVLLDETIVLSEQWNTYIHPLNHLFFFAGGFLIGYLYKANKGKINQNVIRLLLLASVLGFIFVPTIGTDQIYYVVGTYRIIFSLTIFILFYSLMFINVTSIPRALDPLKFLGSISFSLYLFHPLTYRVSSTVFYYLNVESSHLNVFLSTIIAIIVSLFVHYWIDLKISNVITQKIILSTANKKQVAN